MDTNTTAHRRSLSALKDVAAEGLLLAGVAAVGLSLTASASGRTVWGIAAGVVALAAFVLAVAIFRAGRGETADAVKPPEPVLGDSAVRQTERGHLDTDMITLVLPDSASPVVFPVTTVTRSGVVEAVIVGEYGPSGGTAPMEACCDPLCWADGRMLGCWSEDPPPTGVPTLAVTRRSTSS